MFYRTEKPPRLLQTKTFFKRLSAIFHTDLVEYHPLIGVFSNIFPFTEMWVHLQCLQAQGYQKEQTIFLLLSLSQTFATHELILHLLPGINPRRSYVPGRYSDICKLLQHASSPATALGREEVVLFAIMLKKINGDIEKNVSCIGILGFGTGSKVYLKVMQGPIFLRSAIFHSEMAK
jgi:hypothetical protein